MVDGRSAACPGRCDAVRPTVYPAVDVEEEWAPMTCRSAAATAVAKIGWRVSLPPGTGNVYDTQLAGFATGGFGCGAPGGDCRTHQVAVAALEPTYHGVVVLAGSPGAPSPQHTTNVRRRQPSWTPSWLTAKPRQPIGWIGRHQVAEVADECGRDDVLRIRASRHR